MRLNKWQRAWGLIALAWFAYWIWTTWSMSLDAGNVPFILRVIVLPPILIYALGWVVARVKRLRRLRGNR